MRLSTRSRALDKLAVLAAQTAASPGGGEDIERLCTLQQPRGGPKVNGDDGGHGGKPEASAVPMGPRELEVLIALCTAAPSVCAIGDATSLLAQLSPYVPEAHRQRFRPSPLYRHLPPWETLAHDLTAALLAIGLRHPSLRQQAIACLNRTIGELASSTAEASRTRIQVDGFTDPDVAEQALPAIQLSASLLGFMGAVAQHVQLWKAEERVALVQRLRHLLAGDFMVSLEGALSAVRNAHGTSRVVRDWKRWLRHYAANARPLGAMLLEHAFMGIVERSVTLLIPDSDAPAYSELLGPLTIRASLMEKSDGLPTPGAADSLAEIIMDEMGLLEMDADYLQVSSAWQQHLVFEVKATNLRSFLCCSLVDESVADDELLLAWLENITADPVQMADESLASTVFKCMSVLARTSSVVASSLTHTLPRLIVQGRLTPKSAGLAGQCLAGILKSMSQDTVISTLYSLGNVLSTNAGAEKGGGVSLFVDGVGPASGPQAPYGSDQSVGSTLSLGINDEEEGAAVCGSVVQAIVSVSVVCKDAQLTALVISMLVQKIGRINQAIDARIITEMATLGLCGGNNELRALLRLYTRMASEATLKHDNLITYAVTDARVRLANCIRKDSPLYEIYLSHLLGLCVGSGDTAGEHTVDVASTSRTIAQLFRPMAALVASEAGGQPAFEHPEEISTLSRNAWFNIVAHGFTLTSTAGREYARELQIMARFNMPLVDEERVDMPESAIDLNTVLRRGASAQHT
ncbi:phosphatidylinositol-4- kinase, partial [Teratosphaeriaceae sp. CCFEE 6253]